MTCSLLKINGAEIPIRYHFSRKARRSSIRVTGRYAQITVPSRADPAKYSDFIRRNEDWIYRKFKDLSGRAIRFDPLTESSSSIPFKGENLPVSVGYSGLTCYTGVVFEEGSLRLTMPLHYARWERARLAGHICASIKGWLVDRSAQAAGELSSRWKHIADRSFSLRIRELSSRWGSCSSSKGRINLNWRLILTPESVYEYVLVHELCHLGHHRHDREFWNRVGRHIPDYPERRAWLTINGTAIGEFLADPYSGDAAENPDLSA